MNEQKFEWLCPVKGCKKQITAWTDLGMRLLAEEHLYQHKREEREEARQEPPTTMQVYKPKNYDILLLTKTDIEFLKTRGIAVDENIVLDKGDTSGTK